MESGDEGARSQGAGQKGGRCWKSSHFFIFLILCLRLYDHDYHHHHHNHDHDDVSQENLELKVTLPTDSDQIVPAPLAEGECRW